MDENNCISNIAYNGAFLGSSGGVKSADLVGSLGNATELRTPPKQVPDFIDKDTGEILSESPSTDKEKILDSRQLRYDLQDISSRVLYGFYPDGAPVNKKGHEVHHRTCTCNRFRIDNKVSILKSSDHKKTFFGGLMSCANSRTCPVCSAPINERKANEMRVAFNEREALGLKVSLLTFTAPHTAADSIEDLVKKISSALSAFWRGAPAKRFKKEYGIVGHIRSFEVRYGVNGWHPHFHILVFSRKELPLTVRTGDHKVCKELQCNSWLWVLERWQSMCVKSGLNSPNEYGMDIQNGDHAGSYVTKFGGDGDILETAKGKKLTWDMADEITKGNSKVGRKGSLSPWDILVHVRDGSTQEERNKAKLLFLSYARAMVRIALVKWSRGLRSLFTLDEKEATDEEILEQQEDSASVLCLLTSREWKYIHFNNLRPIILQLAESGGMEAVARFLHGHTSKGSFEQYYFEFKQRDNDHSDVDKDSKGDLYGFGSDGQRTLVVKKHSPRDIKLVKDYKYIDL